MTDFFDQAFAFLLEVEKKVYTNNPIDSGGPTKFGITLRAYASFTGREILPVDIAALTIVDAEIFYRARYWSPLNCGSIVNPGIAIAIFDSGVLYGVGTVGLLAQEAVSACGYPLKFDGVLGDRSIAALNAVESGSLLAAFHGLILQRIDSVIAINPKNEAFRGGWTARANRLLTLNAMSPLIKEDT